MKKVRGVIEDLNATVYEIPSGGSTLDWNAIVPADNDYVDRTPWAPSSYYDKALTCPYCGCEYEEGHKLPNCKQCGAPKVTGYEEERFVCYQIGA